MTKISVLMPVYNTKKEFLRESIESILNQTFTDFEFIIINDGSTTNVEEVILSYNDKRIKYIKQDNKGVAKTRNILLNSTTSEFIAFQDSDDISMPNRLEIEYNYLRQNPNISAVSSAFETFPDKQVVVQVHKIKYLDMLHNCCFAQPASMLRLNDFKKNNLFYDESFITSEDYELWSRAIRFLNFVNIPDILLKYRIRPDSLSHSNCDLILKTDNSIRKNMLDYLTNNSEIKSKIYSIIFPQINIANSEKYSWIEKIFSIKNSFGKKHKIITILGVKIKLKRMNR